MEWVAFSLSASVSRSLLPISFPIYTVIKGSVEKSRPEKSLSIEVEVALTSDALLFELIFGIIKMVF